MPQFFLFSKSSPHTHISLNTAVVMRQVAYAAIPGTLAMAYYFGWGVLFNVLFAIFFCLLTEAIILFCRKKPIFFNLNDYSALVTGLLIGLAMPPLIPWWVVLIGCIAAIGIAKQLYGGLGNNPFNPAMVAYVLLLISFPVQMTSWIAPKDLATSDIQYSFWETLRLFFEFNTHDIRVDSITMATPLDSFKTYANDPEKIISLDVLNGRFASYGWEIINFAFLLGGIYLLLRKIINWHIPISMLAGLTLLSCIHALIDSQAATPIFHLLGGATMLGAFFIATDPVSAATSPKGRLVYGFMIGVLIYCLLYTSPSPRDGATSRMPSSA